MPFSSRHYDFKRRQWVFGKATDDATAAFIEKKVFWETKLAKPPQNSAPMRVWIADPAEAQYLQTTPQHLVDIASRLVAPQGLLHVVDDDGLPRPSARAGGSPLTKYTDCLCARKGA